MSMRTSISPGPALGHREGIVNFDFAALRIWATERGRIRHCTFSYQLTCCGLLSGSCGLACEIRAPVELREVASGFVKVPERSASIPWNLRDKSDKTPAEGIVTACAYSPR